MDRELRELLKTYGPVCYGYIHCAPCAVWRSERIQHRDGASRFSIRVHIFRDEQTDRSANARPRPGRYLGYVSLRPIGLYKSEDLDSQRVIFAHIAVAYLAPPKHMLRPRYHIVTTSGGPADGVEAFRSAAFAMPSTSCERLAECLHLAVQCALHLKMYQFQITPVSSQDMTTLLWRARWKDRKKRALGKVDAGEASLKEVVDVLRDYVGTGAAGEAIQVREGSDAGLQAHAMREALSCIFDYLANGIPVIVPTTHGTRNSRPATKGAETGASGEGATPNHAVLVLGMHLISEPVESGQDNVDVSGHQPNVDLVELPGRLICHDTVEGPFVEINSTKFLKSAWAEATKQDADSAREGAHTREVEVRDLAAAPHGAMSGISMLAVLPQGSVRGVVSSRAHTIMVARTFRAMFDNYLKAVLNVPWVRMESHAQPSDIEQVVRFDELPRLARFMRSGQVMERYVKSPASTGRPQNDSMDEKERVRVRAWFQKFGEEKRNDYWWALEVRLDMLQTDKQDDTGQSVRPGPHTLDAPHALVCFWNAATPNRQRVPDAVLSYWRSVTEVKGKKTNTVYRVNFRAFKVNPDNTANAGKIHSYAFTHFRA